MCESRLDLKIHPRPRPGPEDAKFGSSRGAIVELAVEAEPGKLEDADMA